MGGGRGRESMKGRVERGVGMEKGKWLRACVGEHSVPLILSEATVGWTHAHVPTASLIPYISYSAAVFRDVLTYTQRLILLL